MVRFPLLSDDYDQQKPRLKKNKHILVGGISTPLKNMKVSWEESSQYMDSHKFHVPNHQPA
jgi:hypothetical protein